MCLHGMVGGKRSFAAVVRALSQMKQSSHSQVETLLYSFCALRCGWKFPPIACLGHSLQQAISSNCFRSLLVILTNPLPDLC
jgi:hypothetical protein